MSHPSDGNHSDSPYPEQNNSANQPWDHPGQPQSPYGGAQASGAGQDASASAAYGQNSATGAYGQGSAGTAYGQGPSAGGSQIPQDHAWAPAARATGEVGFFRAMVDFKFDHFITVKFSSFLYIVAFLVAILLWLGQILLAILTGAILGSANSFYDEASFNAVPLILAIVFGWIPSVIALIVMRLGLEFSVATVRTAQNTTKIADAATTAA